MRSAPGRFSSSTKRTGSSGRRTEIEQHDGPVVIGARSLQSIPDELRTGLVVVNAQRLPWWRRLIL